MFTCTTCSTKHHSRLGMLAQFERSTPTSLKAARARQSLPQGHTESAFRWWVLLNCRGVLYNIPLHNVEISSEGMTENYGRSTLASSAIFCPTLDKNTLFCMHELTFKWKGKMISCFSTLQPHFHRF